MAAVRATRAALPHLLARAAAASSPSCSVNAFLPDPLVIDYSAAKAALANFCKALSKEVGPQGIRVNTVSPGPVETALWLGRRRGGRDRRRRPRAATPRTRRRSSAAAQAATGRFTRPEEVADLVVCWPAAAPATSPAPTSSSTGPDHHPVTRATPAAGPVSPVLVHSVFSAHGIDPTRLLDVTASIAGRTHHQTRRHRTPPGPLIQLSAPASRHIHQLPPVYRTDLPIRSSGAGSASTDVSASSYGAQVRISGRRRRTRVRLRYPTAPVTTATIAATGSLAPRDP